MPALNIPKKQLLALQSITKLSEQVVDELTKAIGSTPPTLMPDAFYKRVSSKISALDEKECKSILEAILGLSFIKEQSRKTIKEIADDLITAATSESIDVLSFLRGDRQAFENRLSKLTSGESLIVTASALGVMTDYDKVYCGVSVQSDMRLVCVGSDSHPVAGVIVHNISLHYHQDREHKEFYIALDSADLVALKEEIARAEQKEKQLKSVFKKAQLQHLEVE